MLLVGSCVPAEAYHLVETSRFSLYFRNNAGFFSRPIRTTEYFLPIILNQWKEVSLFKYM